MSGSDAVERSAGVYAEEINEVRREALHAMFQFDVATQTGRSAAEVQNRHWEFQCAVVLYLSYLYPYTNTNGQVMNKNLNTSDDEGGEEVTLNSLMAEHGSTDVEEVPAGDAMDRKRTEKREVPVLQPANALRNAVHVLNQQALAMGFLPEQAMQDVSDPNPY